MSDEVREQERYSFVATTESSATKSSQFAHFSYDGHKKMAKRNYCGKIWGSISKAPGWIRHYADNATNKRKKMPLSVSVSKSGVPECERWRWESYADFK